MYALIQFAGKQFKVQEGASIKVPYIKGKVGSKVVIDEILYMDDGKNKTVGSPLINGAKVDGEITSHERGRKVVVFKFKRRKGYQKKNTHRQEYSIIKIGKFGKTKKTSSVTTKLNPEKKESIKKVATKKPATKKPAAKKPAAKKPTQKISKEKKD